MAQRSRVICVQPLDPSTTPAMLTDLFCFHGTISRIAIRGEVRPLPTLLRAREALWL